MNLIFTKKIISPFLIMVFSILNIANSRSLFHKAICRLITPIALYSSTPILPDYIIPPVSAAVNYKSSDLRRLKQGLNELDYLLENWDKKTTYCNFGEFQRELLDEKNKEKLLQAAEEGFTMRYLLINL